MKQQQKKKIKKSTDPCHYCIRGIEPDYKDVETLGKFVSNKGRILPRIMTGVCQKHQTRLSTAVKRARHIALIAFVPQI